MHLPMPPVITDCHIPTILLSTPFWQNTHVIGKHSPHPEAVLGVFFMEHVEELHLSISHAPISIPISVRILCVKHQKQQFDECRDDRISICICVSGSWLCWYDVGWWFASLFLNLYVFLHFAWWYFPYSSSIKLICSSQSSSVISTSSSLVLAWWANFKCFSIPLRNL